MTQPVFRNIGIVAHVDAGKTTTTEHMLYLSGRLKAVGRVDEGTAYTDYLAVERSRGISVRAAVTRLTWQESTINLIDTPGHIDFSAEVERALSVLDGVILVVSAVDGVQAHTETLWHALRAMSIPTVIYVNKVDRLGVNLRAVIEQLRTILHPAMVPIQTVDAEGPDFTEVQSIFGAHTGDSDALIDGCHAILAENDGQLLAAYVEERPIDEATLIAKLVQQAQLGAVFPVLFGASLKGIGVSELLDAVVTYVPRAGGSVDDPLRGVVFKVERDASFGRVAYVRLFAGSIRNRDEVANQTRSVAEKVNLIRQIDVQTYHDTGVLFAGDVGAVYGFNQARIGDVIGTGEKVLPAKHLSIPLLTVQVLPEKDEDYIALVEALQELNIEDPALEVNWMKDEQELHIKVMGTIQLEVLEGLLVERFGLHVSFSQPSVIYKETPKQKAEGYVAYTMPKPCWAILRFVIEPAPRGSGVTYSANVRTEDLLQRYQNEVERRVPEALQQGLYGWEVTDLNITLVEGQHHVWHTHPLDFVVATPMGIMNGLRSAGTQLLEPVLSFKLSVPEEYGGRVLSQLSRMRGEFGNPVAARGRFTVEGTIPLATSLNYPVELGILTGGRAIFWTNFLEYRECPPEVHAERKRRGVNPLDTAKYILWVRNAL
ncbi:elongation factor G [Alicyclobacillus mengziensis]|uniref:TetM/TetW/TetO/TetS family tetracycline resistance ribosomal protection protein n=1 Tax=Alicyclobacillus mengziensis TaxID=2931921 RepID=A0A9X7W0A0_9BACL|nr:TetM/TetW/TetO/TetS family tetracycline resistance ribosomal protection protein [Alicyclobacillus mengziensis]QSO47817.1 TetM/TetW/TetO/TetS family tetracycline resistance ribosomal protection protein [Alicyclobacillus mengziensis]